MVRSMVVAMLVLVSNVCLAEEKRIDAYIQDGSMCYKRPADGAHCCTQYPPVDNPFKMQRCLSVTDTGFEVSEERLVPTIKSDEWVEGGIRCDEIEIEPRYPGVNPSDVESAMCCTIPSADSLWCTEPYVAEFVKRKSKEVQKSEDNGHKWVVNRFLPKCGSDSVKLYPDGFECAE